MYVFHTSRKLATVLPLGSHSSTGCAEMQEAGQLVLAEPGDLGNFLQVHTINLVL